MAVRFTEVFGFSSCPAQADAPEEPEALDPNDPLIRLHERDLMRPDTFKQVPVGTNVVARAVATFGSLLCQYQHRWTKTQRGLYRRAIRSVRHPACPTCGRLMADLPVQLADGLMRKSWHCVICQNY